jgi:DeoR/GlpR family transcriptional regulator of sugar metabolism
MLTSQRKKLLLAALKRDGQLVAKSLSVQFGVSEDTIAATCATSVRACYSACAAEPAGIARRGGLSARRSISRTQKRDRAGRRANDQGRSGRYPRRRHDAVQVARQLPHDLRATVVTHSPSVAIELVDHPCVDVIIIGGRLFKHSIVAVGAAALEALSVIRADLYFMGVTGVHPTAGLSTGDMEEAYVKRALVQHAAETVVLASSEKINAASAYKIADVAVASSIIVNKATPFKLTRPLANLGITIVRA